MKRVVRYFVSYAHDDRKLPGKLLGELQKQLGACKDYEFRRWQDTDILLGEKWHTEIQDAIRECDFGLLLVSPAFLSSNYVCTHELPSFVAGKKPCLPVALCRMDFKTQDFKGLQEAQLFRYQSEGAKAPRAFADYSAKLQADFAHALFLQITARLSKLLAGEYMSARATTGAAADRFHPTTSIPNNLPRLESFFGRTEELQQIRDALDPENRTWGALIDGPGGMGKTSLAVRAAYDCPPEQFRRIIFLSVKDRELDDDGERKLTGFILPGFLELLNELARELGQPDITKAPEGQRVRLLLDALRAAQVLLILDNLESLPKSDRDTLFTFVKRLPQGCKAILTSRRRIGSGSELVPLEKLGQTAALAMLSDLAPHNRLLAKTSDLERTALHTQTGGNPLLLRWVAGQLGRGSCRTLTHALHFLATCPPSNDPLEFVFGDLVGDFTTDETRVLCALTYFSLPARVDHIAGVAGLRNEMAGAALRSLANRSLVVPDQGEVTFALVPMVADFLRRKRPEVVAETGDRLEKRAYALIIANGGYRYDRFAKLDAAWPTIEPALPIFLAKSHDRLNDVCTNLHTFLNFWGRWDERLALCEQAEMIAVKERDQCAAGWRAYSVAIIHYSRGQTAELLRWLGRAERHWGTNPTPPRERAFLLRLQGLTHYVKEEYLEATRCHRGSFKLLQANSPNPVDVSIVLTGLADAEVKVGNYRAAKSHYERAGKLAAKCEDAEGVANSLGKLAALAIIRGDWKKAEELAFKALPLAEKAHRQNLIANVSHHLGKALARQGMKAAGLSHVQRAVDIYTRLGSTYLEDARVALAECRESTPAPKA